MENEMEVQDNKLANQEYVNEWLKRLKINKRDEKTIRAYQFHLAKFLSFIDWKSVTEVKKKDIEEFIGLNDDSNNTNKARQAAIRSFYNWMLEEDYCDKHPLIKNVCVEKETKLPMVLDSRKLDDVLVSLAKKRDKGFCQDRDYVMVYFMFNTGTRNFEVRNVKISDLTFSKEQNLVHVIRKRKREQLIPLNSNVVSELKRYIKKWDITSGYLFPNQKGEHLSPSYLEWLFNEIEKDTGIKDIHPHVMRHTFGTTLLNNGANIRQVQEALGHADLSTTQIYTHVSMPELANVIENLNKPKSE